MRTTFILLLVLFSICLCGCRSQTKSAIIVGKSGIKMCNDTSAYFSDIADGLNNSPYVLSMISKGTTSPTSDEISNATAAANEFRIRAELFAALGNAYQSIEDYANGKPTSINASLSGLAAATSKLKKDRVVTDAAAVANSTANTITDAIIDLYKQRELRHANADFITIDKALLILLQGEESYYVDAITVFLPEEYELAEVLADSGAVDQIQIQSYVNETGVVISIIPHVQWIGTVQKKRLEHDAPARIHAFIEKIKTLESEFQNQIDLQTRFGGKK